MTKEEIQAQLDIILEHDLDSFCEGLVEELQEKLESAKSINELLENAFDCGRSQYDFDPTAGEDKDHFVYKDFKDYLNTINKI